MIDLDIFKLVLIGIVALVVIGPERLPRVARTLGTLLGRAQRYVGELKAQVNRELEFEALYKMRSEFTQSATDIEHTLRDQFASLPSAGVTSVYKSVPAPVRPRRTWRQRQRALPKWFKQRAHLRCYLRSGAARVKRHRPTFTAASSRGFFDDY
ncbi:MAG: twin-arginine translocase TatA/TatE family subunit [Ottowia sp.]|nr:twin-arginine translocase TatA/TatE family subunit [Ottowia sp.]